jgi:hypothetical protein
MYLWIDRPYLTKLQKSSKRSNLILKKLVVKRKVNDLLSRSAEPI